MAFENIRPFRLDTGGFDNALSGFFDATKQRGIDDGTAQLAQIQQQGGGRNALMSWAQANPQHPSAVQFTNALARDVINPPKADPMADLKRREAEARIKNLEAQAAQRGAGGSRGKVMVVNGRLVRVGDEGAQDITPDSIKPPPADPVKGAPPGYSWVDPNNRVAGVKQLPGFEKPVPGDVAGKVALMNIARQSIAKSRNILERDWGAGDIAKYAAANVPLVGDVGMASGDVGMALRDIRTGVEAALRTMTGAAAPEPEVQRYMQMFSPNPKDTKASAQQKIDNLMSFMEDAEKLVVQGRGVSPSMIPNNKAPQQAQPAPAQQGPAAPKTPQEYQALPPGTPYMAPDGSMRIKP
jgi:hypothetical protein